MTKENGGSIVREIVIVVPVYQNKFNERELLSLRRLQDTMGKYDITYIMPHELENDFICKEHRKGIERFSKKFFTGINGYNQLMLSMDFYKRFLPYEFILVYQTDALIVSGELNPFLEAQYDYIGAPWLQGMPVYKYRFRGMSILRKIIPWFNQPEIIYVGNGGVSLRRVRACIDILRREEQLAKRWKENEDVFFSYMGIKQAENFRVASIEDALRFSFETEPRICFKRNKYRLPFACHAWARYDLEFWKTAFNEMDFMI